MVAAPEAPAVDLDGDQATEDVTTFALTSVTPDRVFPNSADQCMSLASFISQRVRCPMTPEATHKQVSGAVAAILDGRLRRGAAGQWWAWTGTGWDAISDPAAREVVAGLIGRKDSESKIRRAVVPYKMVKLTADQKDELLASGAARLDGKVLRDARTGAPITALPVPADEWAESADTVSKVLSSLSGRDSVHMTDEFDADPYVINMSGVLVSLARETLGQTRPLTRYDLVSKSMGTAPDLAAACPKWEMFIAQVCAEMVSGTPQRRCDVEQFLQMATGLQLIGEMREQIILILHGSLGSNGKSVLINTLAALFGDYATTLPQSVVTETRFEGHSTDIMPLRGARFVYLSETPKARWAAETLKRLTSQEPIMARAMRQDNVSWEPTHGALTISTNNSPLVAAGERAFWRRAALVDFKMRWYGPSDGPAERAASVAPVNPDLIKELRAELPGIAGWLVRGLQNYYTYGLRVPAAVLQSTEDARKGASLWASFIAECVEPTAAATDTITAKEMWAVWQKYRDEYSQHKAVSPTSRKDMVGMFAAEAPQSVHVKSQPGQRNVAEHFAKVKWTSIGSSMIPPTYPPPSVAAPATGTSGGATVTPLYPNVGTSAGVI